MMSPTKAGSASESKSQPIQNEVKEPTDRLSLKQLKDAIPSHCFQSSLTTSLLYLARDILYTAVLVNMALRIHLLPSQYLRILAWILYSFAQGCVGTGLWILGHECGHGGFSKYNRINDFLGWLLHSLLLVPYFSWKITHARHHRYTGHITKDVVFVPETEEEHKQAQHHTLLEMMEETPIITLVKLLRHQLIGWQLYLIFNVTAGKDSLPVNGEPKRSDSSHFSTSSKLFLPSQKLYVALSDLGLICTATCLYFVANNLGWSTMLLLYLGPYIWVHHWLVAITYLHHTHPDVPYYTDEAWTFTQGALGTVDRSFGFIGRHLFHEIIDYHLVHHLFPKIPFYHAEEATKAILPLLGSTYIEAKQEPFLLSLFATFRSCNFVRQGRNSSDSGQFFWVIKQE